MPVESRRCRVCRCPEDYHRHYTRPSDTRCGTCGGAACPEYLPPESRRRLTEAQLRTQQAAHQRQLLNVVALEPFTVRTNQDIPVPAQRRHTRSIAGAFAHHLRTRRSR